MITTARNPIGRPKNGMNRKNTQVYMCEEARDIYKKLVKHDIKVALLIENYVLSLEQEYKLELSLDNEFQKFLILRNKLKNN
jgi:hypothetical protein